MDRSILLGPFDEHADFDHMPENPDGLTTFLPKSVKTLKITNSQGQFDILDHIRSLMERKKELVPVLKTIVLEVGEFGNAKTPRENCKSHGVILKLI